MFEISNGFFERFSAVFWFFLCFSGALLGYYYSSGQQWSSLSLNGDVVRTLRNISSVPDTQDMKREYSHAISMIDLNPDSCRILFTDLVGKNLQLGLYPKVSSSFAGIARCYFRERNFDKSIAYYRKALLYVPFYKNKMELAVLYSSVSKPWFYKGNYDSAAVYTYKAAEVLRQIKSNNDGEALLAISIYCNLGTLWNQMHKPVKALEYFKRAKTVSIEYGNLSLMVRIYQGIGSSYSLQGNNDSALAYYEAGFSLNKGALNVDQANLMVSLGNIYLSRKQPEKAIPQYEQAMRLNSLFGDKIKATSGFFMLGTAYYQAEQDDKAEKALLEGFRLAQEICFPDLGVTAGAADVLAKLYENKGQYKKAYVWQDIGAHLLDSLTEYERHQFNEELERSAFKAEKNDVIAQKQLALLAKDGELKEKNYQFLIVSFAVFFLIVLLLSFYKINKHKQKLQSEQIYTLNQEQEIKQLRATLKGEENERARLARELHDGVSSQLASVRLNLDHLRQRNERPIAREEVEDAFQQLDEATVELRKTAHNLMPAIIVDSGLEVALKVFCDRVQRASRIRVDYEVFGQLPRLHDDIELSIYRMIQELLQNVLKHAQANRVLVQLVYQDRLLSVTLEDDGKGYDIKANSQGAGLRNIEERVKMMSGYMEITSVKGAGTTVYLEFDIFRLLKHKTHVN